MLGTHIPNSRSDTQYDVQMRLTMLKSNREGADKMMTLWAETHIPQQHTCKQCTNALLILQERLNTLKSDREREEVAECTFRPTINPSSLPGRPASAQVIHTQPGLENMRLGMAAALCGSFCAATEHGSELSRCSLMVACAHTGAKARNSTQNTGSLRPVLSVNLVQHSRSLCLWCRVGLGCRVKGLIARAEPGGVGGSNELSLAPLLAMVQ